MAEAGSVDAVRRLLQAGAWVNACDNAGWSVLHEASVEGHLAVVKLLLEVRCEGA